MEEAKIVGEIMRLAKRASLAGEVPVGAVVVSASGQIIGRGANKTRRTKDGLMHAEMIAIRQAQRRLADWRLSGCEIYITLEPCLMCLGAIGNARIDKVYFLLKDPLFGSVVSKLTPADLKRLYPKLVARQLDGGEQVQKIMLDFFKGLRQRDKRLRMSPE